MKVEFELCDPDEFLLGFFNGIGEDEHGEFNIFSISIPPFMLIPIISEIIVVIFYLTNPPLVTRFSF